MRKRSTKHLKIENLELSFFKLLRLIAKITRSFYASKAYTANVWLDGKKSGLYGTSGTIAFRLPLPQHTGSGAFLGHALFEFFSPKKKKLALSNSEDFGILPVANTFSAKPLKSAKLPELGKLFASGLSKMGDANIAYLSVDVLLQALQLAKQAGMEEVQLVVMPSGDRGKNEDSKYPPLYLLDTRKCYNDGRLMSDVVTDPERQAPAGMVAVAQVRSNGSPAFDYYDNSRAEGL